MRMTGNVRERAAHALDLIRENQAVMLEQAPNLKDSFLGALIDPWIIRTSPLSLPDALTADAKDRSERFNFKTGKWEKRW